MSTVAEAIKYGIVGVINTVITAAVIAVMMKGFGADPILSNGVGYAAGLINSFIFNKKWTFKSDMKWQKAAIRFGIAFAICYLFQLGVLMWLNRCQTMFDPYYNQLIAMVAYTGANFFVNKFYTFKVKSENLEA